MLYNGHDDLGDFPSCFTDDIILLGRTKTTPLIANLHSNKHLHLGSNIHMVLIIIKNFYRLIFYSHFNITERKCVHNKVVPWTTVVALAWTTAVGSAYERGLSFLPV